METLKRIARISACLILTLAALLACASWYVDYSTSLAIVGDGFNPGLAAIDIDSLDAVVHPTETTPGIKDLISAGKILTIVEGTRCRVIEHRSLTCQGEHHAVHVKLMEGTHSAQSFWMCSDGVNMLYRWL